jgi:hypothetical protein
MTEEAGDKFAESEQLDLKWGEEFLDRKCTVAFNSAFVQLLLPERTGLLKVHARATIANHDWLNLGKDLFWRGSSTDQFKLLLGHFVKCLMLCLRTNSGEIAGGGRLILGCVSSFLNGFQNVVEFSEDDDGPEPTFLERQTLGEVFRETVGRVTGFSSPRAEHERDCEAEIEQLDALLRKFSRCVTSLLLSFGVAKNWNRSCDMFRETLRLLTRMVDDSLKPVLTSQPETERAAGEKVVLNFYN